MVAQQYTPVKPTKKGILGEKLVKIPRSFCVSDDFVLNLLFLKPLPTAVE